MIFIAVSDAGREWPLNFAPNGSHAPGTDHVLEESPRMKSLRLIICRSWRSETKVGAKRRRENSGRLLIEGILKEFGHFLPSEDPEDRAGQAYIMGDAQNRIKRRAEAQIAHQITFSPWHGEGIKLRGNSGDVDILSEIFR